MDFVLQDTFQKITAPKSLKTDLDNLRMKFSALTVDFNDPSRNSLCSRRPAHESIKEGCLFKMRAFSRLNNSSSARLVTSPGVCEWTNENYCIRCQLLRSPSLDFVPIGPSKMHRCRAFPSASAGLFLLAYESLKHCKVKSICVVHGNFMLTDAKNCPNLMLSTLQCFLSDATINEHYNKVFLNQ